MTPAIKWMKEHPNYKSTVSPVMKRFEYKGIMCVGIIAKTYFQGQLTENVTIRPLSVSDDIGAGAGQAIHKEFKTQ